MTHDSCIVTNSEINIGPWCQLRYYYLHKFQGEAADVIRTPIHEELKQELQWARKRPGSQAQMQLTTAADPPTEADLSNPDSTAWVA